MLLAGQVRRAFNRLLSGGGSGSGRGEGGARNAGGARGGGGHGGSTFIALCYVLVGMAASLAILLGLYAFWISGDKTYTKNIGLLFGNATLICVVTYILFRYGDASNPKTKRPYIPLPGQVFTLSWVALATLAFTFLPLLPYKCRWHLGKEVDRAFDMQCNVEVIIRGLVDLCVPFLALAAILKFRTLREGSTETYIPLVESP